MQQVLVILAMFIAAYSYFAYFRDIVNGKTRPHVFSWFIWAMITGIGFAAQLHGGGGLGAWITGFTALMSAFVVLVSFHYGEKNITRFDRACLIGALAAIGLWVATDDPLSSVILITAIDTLSFAPTFRKTFHRPDQETSSMYSLTVVKFSLSIIALDRISIITTLYPATCVLLNVMFVSMLLVRRKQLNLYPVTHELIA